MRSLVITESEARRLEQAKEYLAAIEPGDSPSMILEALGNAFPVESAFIETIHDSDPYNPEDFLWNLRDGFWEWLMDFNEVDPAPYEMTIWGEGRPYHYDHWLEETEKVIGPEMLDEAYDYYENHFGYSSLLNMTLTKRHLGGDTQTAYICMLRDCSMPLWNERDGQVMQLLQPALKRALVGLSLPLVKSQPLLDQILRDRRTGYLLTNADGQVQEMNWRANEVVKQYFWIGPRTNYRSVIESFCSRMIARQHAENRHQYLVPDRGRQHILDISVHHLPRGLIQRPADSYLFMLTERELPARELNQLALNRLTPRQREIARALCKPEKTAKQIAADFDIALGTVNKHCEDMYRRLCVQSRGELVQLLTGGQ